MLEFIGGLIGRRDASERFPRTCVAEERARFYIFQSWRDPFCAVRLALNLAVRREGERLVILFLWI
ncbi:hypothetical protein BLX90_15065 [Rhizobium sp. Y9]|nr:hypothetical protein BLX90_15065 [Rhizobium sp. Y9]